MVGKVKLQIEIYNSCIELSEIDKNNKIPIQKCNDMKTVLKTINRKYGVL